MLGLGYELEFFSSLSDKFDSIILIGENLNKSCYPDFVEPHLNAVKALEEVLYYIHYIENYYPGIMHVKFDNFLIVI